MRTKSRCVVSTIIARESEELDLSDPVHTVSRGGLFGDGESITPTIDHKPMGLKMDRVSQWKSAKSTSRIVIVVFVLVYIAALLQLVFVGLSANRG